MNDQKLKDYLRQADAALLLPPIAAADVAAGVRRRLNRRKHLVRYAMPAAAAILLVAGLLASQSWQSGQKQRQIARLEQQVQQLAAQTEATLAQMQQLLDAQQAKLQAVTRYNDPASQIETALDDAAFLLIYRAERLEEKYNRPDTAADCYRQVIEYFGDTPSAQTARQRLQKIESNTNPYRKEI